MIWVAVGVVLVVFALLLSIVQNATIVSPYFTVAFGSFLSPVLDFVTFFILVLVWFLLQYYVFKGYLWIIRLVVANVRKGKAFYESFDAWLDVALRSV